MQSLTRDPRRGLQTVVVRVTGELDLDTQDLFQQTVDRRLDSPSVVVDLSDVEFVSVSALKVLLACHRLAQNRRHRLVFAALPGQARRLLALAGLDEELEICETVAEATGYAAPAQAFDLDLP